MKYFYLFVAIMVTNYVLSAAADDTARRAELDAAYQSLDYTFDEPFVRLNPFGRNELAAMVRFPTKTPTRVTVRVAGRDGAADLVLTDDTPRTEHEVAVLGLYPDYDNKVTLIARDADGQAKETTLTIPTKKIRKRALIVIENKADTATRYHYLHDGVVFDEDGWIRLSFQNNGEIVYWMSGELIAEDRTRGLVRYTMSGEEKQRYPLPEGFVSFAHGIGQKPNGNFLVIGSFAGKTAKIAGQERQTQRDFVIELDYETGAHVNTIDLAALLNPDRSVIVKSAAMEYGLNDWCHVNSVDYDSDDGGVVVSCRHAGIVKINERKNEIKWVLAPHRGFEKTGRDGTGSKLSRQLLTAYDNLGKPYPKEVQDGLKKADGFKWPTKTHDAKIHPYNFVSVFDNAGPLYDTQTVSTDTSNAAVYSVDEYVRNVTLVWFQPLPFLAESASSVLYRPAQNEVIVYAATVKDKNQTGFSVGKLIRYDLKSHKPLFTATVYRGGETYFYRVDDFSFDSKYLHKNLKYHMMSPNLKG